MSTEYKERDLKNLVPEEELEVRFARSSGRGGQNVNRRETKVQIFWPARESHAFSDEEKERIVTRVRRDTPSRITDEDVIFVSSQKEREQHQNLLLARERLNELVARALRPEKKRKKPIIKSPESVRRRIKAERKGKLAFRRKPEAEE